VSVIAAVESTRSSERRLPSRGVVGTRA